MNVRSSTQSAGQAAHLVSCGSPPGGGRIGSSSGGGVRRGHIARPTSSSRAIQPRALRIRGDLQCVHVLHEGFQGGGILVLAVRRCSLAERAAAQEFVQIAGHAGRLRSSARHHRGGIEVIAKWVRRNRRLCHSRQQIVLHEEVGICKYVQMGQLD